MLKLFDELKESVLKEDFYNTNDILEKIKKEKNVLEYIDPILRLMETNPNLDFGTPGPIVHFLESYYKRGYEDALLESVMRSPTCHTVWMINRIMNNPSVKDKHKYLKVLERLLSRNDLPRGVLEDIKGFLEYQNYDKG